MPALMLPHAAPRAKDSFAPDLVEVSQARKHHIQKGELLAGRAG
jgi:hypothetical protein